MFLFLKSNRNHIFSTLLFNVPHDSESAPISTASSSWLIGSGEHLCHKRTSSNSLSVFLRWWQQSHLWHSLVFSLWSGSRQSLCWWWADMFIFKTKTGTRLWSSSNALGPEGLTSWPRLPYFRYSWLTGSVVTVKVVLEVSPKEHFLHVQHYVRGCPGYKYKHTPDKRSVSSGEWWKLSHMEQWRIRQYAIKC